MSLFYQHNINQSTKLAIWKIEEDEAFFLSKVPLQKSITHPHKRLQHLAARYLLQLLFPDFPYTEIVIADTNKPYLPYEQYHFSISHCGNFAAAIVSLHQRVGIDIELASDKVLKVAHKFLSKKEMQDFGVTTQNTFTTTLIHQTILLWNAKEAIFKWWGWGNINFSEEIRLQQFDIAHEGIFNAIFSKANWVVPIEVQYKIFENLCLCWVVTDADIANRPL